MKEQTDSAILDWQVVADSGWLLICRARHSFWCQTCLHPLNLGHLIKINKMLHSKRGGMHTQWYIIYDAATADHRKIISGRRNQQSVYGHFHISVVHVDSYFPMTDHPYGYGCKNTHRRLCTTPADQSVRRSGGDGRGDYLHICWPSAGRRMVEIKSRVSIETWDQPIKTRERDFL